MIHRYRFILEMTLIAAFAFTNPLSFPAGARTPSNDPGKYISLGKSAHRPAFVPNRGQVADPEVRYSILLPGARLHFTDDGISMLVSKFEGRFDEAGALQGVHTERTVTQSLVRLLFMGTSGARDISAESANNETFNFYSGRNPGGILDVPSYNEIYYRGIYPNIDARFRITSEGLKYEFIVHPGGNPSDIRLEYGGVSMLGILPGGGLQAGYPFGSIEDAAPVSYSQGATVSTRFAVSGLEYGFEVGAYDKTRTLVIDPCIMWSSFYGGSTSDLISGVATDSGGFIIFTGFTSSVDFPAASALQEQSGGSIDAFIVKVDGEGNRQWATYYGGAGSEDWPRIATDPSNSIIIGGYTSSMDFPASSGAYQRENGGKFDAFILKLTSQGKRDWATLYGGSFAEECGDIASDGAGGIYITGHTFSTNLPVTENADQTSNQGDFDAYVAKFDAGGSLLWATYLGGWSLDYGTGLAISPAGTLAVTGYTESTNFPVGGSAMQDDHNGGRYDAFIAAYNTNGRRLWSTYYGGEDEDQATGAAFGPDGTLFVCGHSKSGDLDTQGEGQNTFGGSHDAFIASFSSEGNATWLSYFGGKGSEQATGIAVDAKGTLYVCGFKIGEDMPGADGGFKYDTPNSMDAFLLKLDSQGNRLWATSYGGPLGDLAYGVALDDKGNIIMAGETGSKAFPTAGAAMQKSLAGFEDGFIVKFLFYEPLVEAGDDQASCAEQGVVLEASVTQGVPPYTFAWTPAQGLDDPKSKTPRAIPDRTTTYTLTVTDSYGCIGSDTVTVMVNERPTVDPGSDKDLCPGTPAQLAADVSGGSPPYKYEWSPAAGLSAVNVSNPTASPSATTTYVVRVTDAKGCTHRDSLTVHVLPAPVADAGSDKVVCLGSGVAIGGEANGGSPPYAYEWNPKSNLDNPLAAAPIASPQKDAVYTVTVTDSKGCSASATVRVTVLPSLTISAGKDVTICYGETVPIGGKPKGGKPPYAFSWSPEDGLTSPRSETTNAAPRATTTYTLTVTDASGCVTTDEVTISVRDRLIAAAGDDNIICAGAGASIGGQTMGGTPPYTYAWQPAVGLSSSKAATPTATPGKTTNYIVTVSDAAGCTASDTITLTVIETPKPVLLKDASLCQGESIKLDATVKGGRAPYAYAWNPPFGIDNPGALSPTATPAQTVTYVLTVTDAAGCMGTGEVTITVHPAPRLDEGKSMSICRGATAEIGSQASGGKGPYKYKWTPGEGAASTTDAVTKVRPRNTTAYTLTVTDANGCTATATYAIEVLDCPSGDAGRDAEACLGAGVKLGGETTGGRPPYSYQWVPASGLNDPTDANPIASPAATTAYEMTITDANGCKFQDSVKVAIFDPPQVTAGADRVICHGSPVELAASVKGGVKPFEYFWTPSDQLDIKNRETFTAVPKETTTFVVTVKDASGCSASDSVLVSVAPPLAVEVNEAGTICKGSTVELLAAVEGGQPPFSFEWLGVEKNDAKKKTVSISPDRSASYIVKVTDAAGCVAADSVFVAVESVPVPDIVLNGSNPACQGDTVRLRVKQEYAEYEWSTGESDREILVTEAATLTVKGANEKGCSAVSAPLNVRFNARPAPEILSKGGTEICQGSETVLSVSKKFKQYAWSNGEKSASIKVREAGEYSVTVADANGCTGTSNSIRIAVHPRPAPAIAQQSDTLSTDEAAGYQWNRNNRAIKGATGRTFIAKESGKYTVRIKNENGCEAVSDAIQITISKKKK